MPEILHRIGIRASIEDVRHAIATREGVAGWWARDTRGDARVGGTLQLHFAGGDLEVVIQALGARQVRWGVLRGPAEWIGTTIEWDLHEDGEYAIVLFAHRGWREPVAFMHHCSTKWAVFLLSLKALVETGTGTPDPDDVKIDNWN